MLTPPPAEANDKIAILAPSSQVPEIAVERGKEILENEFNLVPEIYPSVTAEKKLSPANRAEEIHRAFESEATAVFAVTGGEDQMRLLRHIELDGIQSNPTRFFGISDNTHLHLALSSAGIVSYYGGQFLPSIIRGRTLPEYTKRYLKAALFEKNIGKIQPANKWTDDNWSLEEERSCEWNTNDGWNWEFPEENLVTGSIWGGCFLAIEHFLATNYHVPEPSTMDDTVVVVESSGLIPEPYLIKSVLRCMGERGYLKKASAVLVGRPKTQSSGNLKHIDQKKYIDMQFSAVYDVLRSYQSDIPIIFNVDFGHTDPHVPIPIGGTVQLDPIQKSITFRK